MDSKHLPLIVQRIIRHVYTHEIKIPCVVCLHTLVAVADDNPRGGARVSSGPTHERRPPIHVEVRSFSFGLC